jgi:carbamoyl-phosphate synthase large subunit
MKNNIYKKVMVIGSGPIVIGQAAEFDYSGTQACRVLREEGIYSILINSNPATIMTDTSMADAVYIEPLTLPFLEKIIAKERPQGLLAGMGGQTALNLALELADAGILQQYGVQLMGTDPEAIRTSEDRELFKELMKKIGEPVIDSMIVSTSADAVAWADENGYPVVVRPAFTLGGTGGGIAYNKNQLETISQKGIEFSRMHQILVEKYIKGWKEIEYEMIRDGVGNVIAVCNMENLDPVGIHTGDSIVVAPSQTLSDKEYQMLRNASIHIVNSLNIVGGCNVQFALNPFSFEYKIIEVNPRVSRSSALASKATGYPIAKVATKIALGYGLDHIKNEVTGRTMSSYEPALDYCVVKIPKWPFDKLQSETRQLGTMMMATGEVMAIGNRFESALLKGLRSLENGLDGFTLPKASTMELAALEDKVQEGSDERIFYLAELLRRGADIKRCAQLSMIDPWFVHKIQNIIHWEKELEGKKLEQMTADQLRFYKQRGFSDSTLASYLGESEAHVRSIRKVLGVLPVYKMVDTCAGEFDAVSNYFYSTYDKEDESMPSSREKVIVIGSGPIRIGQGVEFDYCSVHGVLALREMGYEAILINNNPETVSTDFDISDKLYFEPITNEEVMNIVEKENPLGVILQFGGQTAIKLADYLEKNGVRILGTTLEGIDAAENRETFDAILAENKIRRPEGTSVMKMEEGILAAQALGYPVLVRPSYVIGGLGMEIAWNSGELENWLKDALTKNPEKPVLIDKYLNGIEIEVDGICDGKQVLIPGIMEHLERAGVHSGDSISVYPPLSLTQKQKEKILHITETLATALGVIGLINIQFVLSEGKIFVIEVNPRASRTVPYISKVTGIPMIEAATKVLVGQTLFSLGYGTGIFPERNLYAVKVPVFSMDKIPGAEVAMSPEMKSTGEVLGVEYGLSRAMLKAFLAAGMSLPKGGRILASICDQQKAEFIQLAIEMNRLGYEFCATGGTKDALEKAGVPAFGVGKIHDGKDNILDSIQNKHVSMVINIPSKGKDSKTDGFRIRRAAVENRVPCYTSLDTLWALCHATNSAISPDELNIFNIHDLSL